jgi:hypothetical protein
MNLGQGLRTVGMAATAARRYVQAPFADQTTRRIGFQGNLFRLIQVSLVEVASFCNVDRRNVVARCRHGCNTQASKKKPRTYADYRDMRYPSSPTPISSRRPKLPFIVMLVLGLQSGLSER